MTKRKFHFVNESDSVIHKMFWDSFFVMLSAELSVAISNIIDGLMVSNFLGPEMFAAQSLVSPFFGMIAIASGLLATGAQITVSKRIVKGKFEEADHAFTLATMIGLIIAIGITAVCFLFRDGVAGILGASKADIQLFDATKAYLMGLGLGSIPLTLNVILQPILQINGDKTRVKRTMFLIMATNCVMNALSIFVFDLGMFGIGLATSIAQWLGLLIYLLHFTNKKIMCRFWFSGIRLGEIKDIFVLGLPKATVRVCNTLRPLLINRWILVLSTSAAISAVGINNNIRDLFRIPETAVALSVMLIAATLYGERDKTALKKLLRISMGYNVLINFVLSLVVLIFAPLLASVYVESGTQIHSMACACLRWTAIGLLFYAVNEYFMDFMLGTGRHKQVHIFTFLEKFLYAVLWAYLLGWLFGIEGVFASFSVAEMCFTVHIVISIWVKNKKFPKKLSHFMLLPKDFADDPKMTLEVSVSSMEEVIGVSERVMSFCQERGVDDRRSFFSALCTEELAANIVKHGFKGEKPQSLMIRISLVEDDLILRFRDSCKLFDIREQYEASDKQDMTKNIGIRLVMKMAKDVMYLNTLNINTTIIKI